MKRPLLVIGVSFFLSTAAALLFGDNFSLAVGITLLAGGLAAPFFIRLKASAVTAALMAGAAAMGGVLLQNMIFIRPVMALADRTVYLEGRVTRADYEADSARYLLDARIPLRGGGTARTVVRVYSRTPLPVELNEELRGYIALYDPQLSGKSKWINLANRILLYGKFDERAEIARAAVAKRTPGYYITALREYLTRQNQRLLSPDDAALVNAVLLGEKGYLPEETRQWFQRSGLSHLMAVSGFHLSLIAALAQGLLRLLGMSRQTSAAVVLPLTAGFVALAGFTSSVVRAGIMTGLCLLASLVGRKYDPLSALGLALLVICAVNPYSAVSAGFLLSFTATAGIILVSPLIFSAFTKKCKKGRRPVRQALSVSVGAYLLTLPVMLFYFDSFSLLSPLASVLAMPFATAMLWCAAPVLALSAVPFLFPAARLISWATALFARLTVLAARLFASIPFAVLPVRYESVKALILLLYAGAAVLILFHAPTRVKQICAIAGAAVLTVGWGSAWLFNRNTVQIVTFDNTDAALIVAGDRAALIGLPQTRAQGNEMLYYLQNMNILKMDLAVSLGQDNDDALGAVPILERIPAARLLIPDKGAYTPHLLRAARNAYRGVPNPQKEMRLAVLGMELTLFPCSCGRACKIDVGDANLLKTNQDCAIMKVDARTQGVVRGWTLVKRRADSGTMKIAFDGERTTVYTFRRRGGDGA